MKKEHYLDWAATSPCEFFAKDYYELGNPNSVHRLGTDAHRILIEQKGRIKSILSAKSGQIVVGSVASVLAKVLMDRIYDKQGFVTYCSPYEHSCIYDLSTVKIKGEEIIDTLKIIQNNVYFHQHVNNITGEIFLVDEIGRYCREHGAYYIMDCVASVGHESIPEGFEDWCDCIITSAHKYGGPHCGFMWLSDRFIKFLDLDNAQDLVPGTPDVASVYAMADAFENAVNDIEDKNAWYSLYTDKILEELSDAFLINPNGNKTYAINAIAVPDVNADALVQFLSSCGVYISPGHSACSDAGDYRVLGASGLTHEQAAQTIRVSFGPSTCCADIDALVAGIKEYKEMFL